MKIIHLQRQFFHIIIITVVTLICQSSISEIGETQKGQIRLIVRADDIASFHAANLACIKTYREGVARSVEIMVPCAWFPEAVKLLNENPGFDVGVHLVLTSEWDNIKWRPLTHVPGLVDKDGYFYPNIWGDPKKAAGNYLLGAEWKIEEIEQELRAQIELARKYLPQISHLTAHMGLTNMHRDVKSLVGKLAKEYNLSCEEDFTLKQMQGFGKAVTTADKIETLLTNIKRLTPGTWITVDHPGLDGAEMQTVNFNPDFNLGKERQAVTDVWTNEKVKKALIDKGVELIGYKDLKSSK
jgi:predicted glycoside hydrolase/deacetylase ChbG (UPF0249 family)